MSLSSVESFKSTEVVYLPEMAKSDGIRVPGWALPTLAAAMIGLAAWWFNTHLPIAMSQAVEGKTAPLEIRLTKIETYLKLTSKDAASVIGEIPKLLRESASDSQHLEAALAVTKDVVSDAQRENRVLASPESIAESGALAIAAIPKISQPQLALEAIGALASYRTLQIASVSPSGQNAVPIVPANWNFSFFLENPPWETHAQLKVLGEVRSGDAARWEPLGGDINRDRSIGPQWLFVEGIERSFSISLDGQRLRNVVARNVTLHYSGGAIALDNVYFVDCTLAFTNSVSSLDLASKVFNSNQLVFNR